MELFLKVLSDMDCSLYVDGEFVQLIKADSLTKISLRRGEYFIQCTSTLDSTVSQSDELLLEYDRIYKVSLLDIILRNKDACEQLELEPRKNEDELYGYYLKGTSKCIIPHKYKEASEFISLYAIVSDGKTRSVILKNGKFSIPFGIFSNIVLDIECDQVLGFHVYKKENYPGGWGYISIKYDFLTIADCLYCGCTRYNDFLLCENENGNNVDVLYSLQNGEERLRADAISIISDPEFPGNLPLLFFVKISGLYGVVDDKLDNFIPTIYKAYNIQFKGEIDEGGNYVVDNEMNNYYQYKFYSNERFIAADYRAGIPLGIPFEIRYIHGKKYFVSTNQEVTDLHISKLTFYQNLMFGAEEDIKIAVLINSLYSYTPNLKTFLKGNRRAKKKIIENTILLIDSNGKKELIADSIDHYYNDYAIVTRNDKKTFVDLKGNFLTDFKYVSLERFYEGVSIVSDGKGYGAINTKGQEIIPCMYKSISYPIIGFDGIIIAFDSSGKKTYFDKEGNETKKASRSA